MFRLYLGNLAAEASAETLHELFASEGLSPSNIVVKRGYAFVDCPDQDTFDKALDSLNGKTLFQQQYRNHRWYLFKITNPIISGKYIAAWISRHGCNFFKMAVNPRVHIISNSVTRM